MNINKWILKNAHSLKDKTYIVTGANSGIGFYLAYHLASLEANVILACRNLKKGEQAKEKILKDYPSTNIMLYEYDQASFKKIESFVESIKKINKIDGLVCNAGVYYPKKNYKTEDNLELTIGTNYFGVFHLIDLLKEKLENDSSRVVFVTSLTATTVSKRYNLNDINKMKRNKLYGYSKYLISCLCQELMDEKDSRITYRLVHPGITCTNILNSEKTGFPSWFSKAGHDFLYLFVHSPKKASLCSLLGLIDEEKTNKKYIVPRFLSISGFPRKKKIHRYANKRIIERTRKYLEVTL